MEFAESYQACLHGSATDPLLDVFMDYCDDQYVSNYSRPLRFRTQYANSIHYRIDKLSDPDQFNDDFRFRNPAEEAALWIAERNTWDLISRLYAYAFFFFVYQRYFVHHSSNFKTILLSQHSRFR